MSPRSPFSFQELQKNRVVEWALRPSGLLGRSGAKPAPLLCAIVTCILATCEMASGDDGLIQIGQRKQLLVDNYVVAEKSGVSRVLGTVTKENGGKPILLPDKPWENAPYQFGFYVTVLREGEKFRMWYRPNSPWIAYAESSDGLVWRKPVLGIYSYDGTGKANNLTDHIGDGFSLFRDAHEKDPEHRYKGAYCPTAEPYAACLNHSADGLRWTPYHHGKPVTHRAADFSNQILWDDEAKVYLLITRTDFGPGGGPDEIRGVRIMSNPDIKAKDMVVPAFNILTRNDRHWIYYTGNRERHSVDVRWPMIGLATLRLDGFVALEAGNQTGEILTKPFLLEGTKLQVNVEAPNGEWRVELLDQKGRAIEGFAGADAQLYQGTDSIRFEPRWKKGLRPMKGQPVRLKFHLRRARVYSFQVQ
jgi:hypothetical protein